MFEVLMSFDCPACGHDENYIKIVTMIDVNGVPVISADSVSQVSMVCTDEDCQENFLTSDLSEIMLLASEM